MTKSHLKATLILISLITLLAGKANSQMHCRSILGSHLTQFNKEVPLYWALEGTMAPGIMSSTGDADNAKLNGGMVIGALDYSFSTQHSLYAEGGYKNWQNSELSQPVKEFSQSLGMRQLFYNYKDEKTDLKVGLHEMKMGDYYLVDERVIGIGLDRDMGAFTLNLRGGTVTDNYARMGRFCANRHLYGLITNDFTERIGEKPGETNLAGAVLNWNPGYTKPQEKEDEFSEFSSAGNEFGEEKEVVSNVGFILYSEFGGIISDSKIYAGSLIDMNLPGRFKLQTGGVYQNMKDHNALVYTANLGKNIVWKSGDNTEIGAAWIGKYEIDDGAVFQPLFSNLFLGEIMRLDATDFPLWQGSVKYRFAGNLNFHTAVKVVGQVEGNETSEIDLELGAKLFNHSKLTAIFSRVETQALEDDIFMGRLEVRVAF